MHLPKRVATPMARTRPCWVSPPHWQASTHVVRTPALCLFSFRQWSVPPLSHLTTNRVRTGVCCVVCQGPRKTILQLVCENGAAALADAPCFLARSGTLPLVDLEAHCCSGPSCVPGCLVVFMACAPPPAPLLLPLSHPPAFLLRFRTCHTPRCPLFPPIVCWPTQPAE
jgi:hypothetical protein